MYKKFFQASFIMIALLLALNAMVVAQDAEPVVISWRFPTIDPASLTDIELIEDAANEIIEPEIGVRIDLVPIELGEYNTTMTTISAAGEEYDLAYTSWWTFDYWQNASLGAFTPLDDLLDEHAPVLVEKFPDYIWRTATVNGTIYALPHQIKAPGPHGWVLMERLVEAYDFDVSSVQEYDDVEPFLQAVVDNNPDLIPAIMGPNGYWEAFSNINNLEEITVGVGFDRDAEGIQVVDLFETQEYAEYVSIMHEWWNAGYIWDEAPTTSSTTEQLQSGNVAALTNRDLITSTSDFGGEPYINIGLGPSTIRRNTALPHATAISQTSQHPTEAVTLVNLIHSNRELYRLLTYGVEGEHYELNEDGRLVRIENSGYNIRFDWPFGDPITDGYRPAGEDPDFLDNHFAALAQGVPSKLLGFTLNTDPISAELAQLQAVNDQFIPQLNTGAGNPDNILPQFLDQRQASGVQNVIEEIQSQIDAWQAAQ